MKEGKKEKSFSSLKVKVKKKKKKKETQASKKEISQNNPASLVDENLKTGVTMPLILKYVYVY